MRTEKAQNVVMIGLILSLGAGVGLAYWYGSQRAAAGAAGPIQPIKRFRADPGTERENARALLSSIPSIEEESTDRPIDVWGSQEPESDSRAEISTLQLTIRELSDEQARETLRSRLAGTENAPTGEDRAQLEAALAWALLHGEPRDVEGSREAFARALSACLDAKCRVELAFVYGERLYEAEEYEETLELLQPGRFVGSGFDSMRFSIEALRGHALDALGRDDAAQAVYEKAFESALDSDLNDSPRGRDAARVVALRLARIYREQERANDATAVSRRLRAWLGEEELVLR